MADPATALLTLRAATGEGGEPHGLLGRHRPGGLRRAGPTPASVAPEPRLCSGDLLLAALAARAQATYQMVAAATSAPVASAHVTAEGTSPALP